MAGSEDRSPPDENSEWSDFSSNSSTTNTFDSLSCSLKSLNPVFVFKTLISCFPPQSDPSSAALSLSDKASNSSGTNNRSKFSWNLNLNVKYRFIAVVFSQPTNSPLCILVHRILDGVDPSLETYGEPLAWRSSQSEVKHSRALNLPPSSCEVSEFSFY